MCQKVTIRSISRVLGYMTVLGPSAAQAIFLGLSLMDYSEQLQDARALSASQNMTLDESSLSALGLACDDLGRVGQFDQGTEILGQFFELVAHVFLHGEGVDCGGRIPITVHGWRVRALGLGCANHWARRPSAWGRSIGSRRDSGARVPRPDCRHALARCSRWVR